MTDFTKKHIFTPLYMSPKKCQCGKSMLDPVHEDLFDHVAGERDDAFKEGPSGATELKTKLAEILTPERAEREGDQKLPIVNDNPFVHDLMKEDVEARKQLGIRRYGTPLQGDNGRDTLRDVYEELLDAAVYIRTLIFERDRK